MEREAAAAAGPGAEPIAIVGYGGVFPGARTLEEFWQLIERGVDTCRPVPPGRWVLDPQRIQDPTPGTPDRVLTDRGCFIEGFQLDAAGLNLPAELLRELDPSVHLLLEAGRNAFASARMEAVERGRVGVVVGNIVLPTDKASQRCLDLMAAKTEVRSPTSETSPKAENRIANQPPGKLESQTSDFGIRDSEFGSASAFGFRPSAFSPSLPAALLARGLGLGAGAFTLDAACASSLYALKLACDDLRAGRADAMLAGGLSRPDSLYTQMGFSQLRALAPSGRCAPFDAAGSGLIVGEGAGVVVLKRLADALRDGDTIHAVIRGIGLSCDLDGNLLSPSSEGQLRALKLAYAQAGWTPDQVDFIECHATGTPVGDAVEFGSLLQLWREGVAQASSRCGSSGVPTDATHRQDACATTPPWQSGQCVLGAVKANIGHLLTGAGAASLIKLLLALKHQTLPATANFTKPSSKIALDQSPFRILRQSQPWPRRSDGSPRRAAINGFGFGGINAHVLIEEWLGTAPAASGTLGSATNAVPIAVIGLAAQVGSCSSLRTFARCVLAGEGEAQAEPRHGVAGYFSRDLTIPLNRYRIPPKELAELLPQQAAMLEAARAALADAGTAKPEPSRAGVFIGLELDPRTTDFHFRWAELAAGRETAAPALTADRTLGALAGVAASRIAKEFHFGGQSFTVSGAACSGTKALEIAVRALQRGELDQALAGAVDFPADPRTAAIGRGLCGEGAVALVLKRLDDAQRDGDRIYAVVRQLGTGHEAGQLGELSLSSSDLARELGDTGAAAGLLTVAQACLALYHEILPPAGSVPAQPWVRDRADGPRRACVNVGGPDGVGMRVLLAECEAQSSPRAQEERAQPIISGGDALFVFAAQTQPALIEQIARAKSAAVAASGNELADLAVRWWVECAAAAFKPGGRADWRLALVAQDSAQLVRLLEVARERVYAGTTPAESNLLRADRDRVFFTPPDQRLSSGLAFVFPGAGNTFPDMGRELALRWPKILRAQDRENERLASQMCVDRFWNSAAAEAIGTDHRAAICGQVALGTMVSDLAVWFGLKPDAVVGYSLGESTGLFALRAWTARDEMLRRVTASTLFSDDLTGKPEQLRRAWRVPQGQPVEWLAGLVDCPAADVRAAIAGRKRVYILIVNTPGECVIGGDATEVRAVVAKLGCHWWPLQGVSTVHCELLQPFAQPYRELHLFPTTAPAGMRFFSGGWGREYVPDRETAAEAIVAQASGTVDFPRVVRTAYDSGMRFFLEMGPGNSCSRMIGQILESQPHLARSLCASAQDSVLGVLRVLAELVAQGVEVDLASLYQTPNEGARPANVSAVASVKIAMESPLFAAAGVRSALRPAETTRAAVDARERGVYAASGLESEDGAGLATASTGPAMKRTEVRVPNPAEDPFEAEFLRAMAESQAATVSAHQAFLEFSQGAAQTLAQTVRTQMELMQNGRIATAVAGGAKEPRPVVAVLPHPNPLPLGEGAPGSAPSAGGGTDSRQGLDPFPPLPAGEVRGEGENPRSSLHSPLSSGVSPAPVLDRAACLEFARGKVGDVLGPEFAPVDRFPTRVRLPDEPLMLVDRILEIHGEARSMTHGRVVTEHDILPGAWYLDCGRIPTCIAVEAGQADLFLSGYLGVDFQTKGLAVYRLLDAKVCFHRSLPGPGEVIHYDIRIDHFFQQSGTWLFRFNFEATVNGAPLLTMTDGCAGFFSAEELAGGRGIVQTAMQLNPMPGKRAADWEEFVPFGGSGAGAPPAAVSRAPRPPSGTASEALAGTQAAGAAAPRACVESYTEAQLDALRAGDLAGCFGAAFANLPLRRPITLPSGRMKLVHRVPHLDPEGGRFGLGLVRGEADIHPDGWFLTCHFVDDRVMPGTLMFECCLHTLRVFLLRLGWVVEEGAAVLEPVPGVVSQLKCRGQVLETTRTVTYEVAIKEIGYRPEPYVIADALMYADGKAIVEIGNMSLRYTGVARDDLRKTWGRRNPADSGTTANRKAPSPSSVAVSESAGKRVLYGPERILAFAVGKPSDAFGEPYRVFDEQRRIARLPGPPYQFLDRITEVTGEPFKLAAGGVAVAEYDVPADAWYFAANRQGDMPFAVLLEIALQPCGWLAAYCGSALTSDTDLSFRNLGGKATQLLPVLPDIGTLTTRVKLTKVSSSAGMIIQWFDMEVRSSQGVVYQGDTYFGFFPAAALAKQEGIRDAKLYQPAAVELARARSLAYPTQPPFPDAQMRMVEQIESYISNGGPHALGFIRATKPVVPEEWFFKAHFYQDPVVPGSLGLESFLQLLKFLAVERWGETPGARWEAVAVGEPHEWVYRGQVIPRDKLVTVEASVTAVDEAARQITANGFLSVDGRVIYGMKNFTVRRAK